MKNVKTVVTMTSWTKRIELCSVLINKFFKEQTVLPDLFYLWLSKEEFTSVEELPKELQTLSKNKKIIITFLDGNEKCYKRWHVFPKHYNDIVISLDDDTLYPKTLVETVNFHYKFMNNKCVYNIFYNLCGRLTKDHMHGIGVDYAAFEKEVPMEIPGKTRLMNGQCVFMPKTFPLETLEPEITNIRKKICPLDEETWYTAWLYCKYNTNIGALPYNYIKDCINYGVGPDANFHTLGQTLDINNVTLRDLQLYIILRSFPQLFDNWIKLYPWYNDSNLCNYTVEELIELKGGK